MPRLLLLFLIAVQACVAAVSGVAVSHGPVNGQGRHGEYRSALFLDRMRNSREILFAEIVRHYDSLLAARPNPVVHIEKCKFLADAMYDVNEEYNPKEGEWDSCYQEALRRYPDDARVMAYRLRNSYGDSAMLWGLIALDRVATNRLANADDTTVAEIHQALARAYDNQDSARKALKEYQTALRLNDTLNLGLEIARQMFELGQKDPALTALLRGEPRLEKWEAAQAGELLLRMGYAREAARFYGKHIADTTLYTDYAGLAKALEQAGEIDSARFYNAKALDRNYGKERTLRRQFEFDLRYSSGSAAATSYRAFRAQGIKADPFGFYRLKLFALHPLQPVAWQDLLGLALLLAALLAQAAAPYLWVLPFHYLMSRWVAKRLPPGEARFNLRHFWWCSAAFLIAGFLAMGFFHTAELGRYFGLPGGVEEATDGENALFLCAFSALMFVFTAGLLRATRSRWVFRFGSPPGRTLLYLAACVASIYLVRLINIAILPEDALALKRELFDGSILTLIKSALATLGLIPTLLIVAVMVPIYEEVLFRGVFQESTGKYLPFWIVNPLQAAVFAGLHENLRQFPTLFAMGLCFGWLARKTGSLAVPMLAHGVNNAIAVTTVWVLLKHLAAGR